MKTLVFKHSGWTVVTPAWTVATKSIDSIEICYVWSSSNGMGWSDASTGVAKVTFNMKIEDFLALVNGPGDVIDLRPKPIGA